MNILKDPKLLNKVVKELDKMIVKERDLKMSIFVVGLGGMNTNNAEPTSYNLMVNDGSGAGKDYIVKCTLKIFPKKENIIIRKRISPTVFTYWHNSKFEPDWTWDGKLFYNEDISNTVLNCDVFKVMSSSDGENISEITVNQRPVEVITRGKPVMIITTAMANPKVELLRRFPIAELTTTIEQTKLILERKAEFHKKGIKPSYDARITKALAYLKSYSVKVPFADRLTNLLSHKNIIVRTHFDRLIDYIKFSAVIHQYQRESDDEGHLIATSKDYECARIVFLSTTSNILSIPLTKNQKEILMYFRKSPNNNFSVSDLETHITFLSERQLYRELDKLVTFGFLTKDKEERDGARKPVMVYSYVALDEFDLPEWDLIDAYRMGNSIKEEKKQEENIDVKEEKFEG